MTTLLKPIKLVGKGIHSGATVEIKISPSKKRGIYFLRTDIAGAAPILATYDNVGEAKMRNTTIGNMSGAHVQTIEHLMAALFVAGVDSALVEIDGAETPIMDGSAYTFLEEIAKAFETGRDYTEREVNIIIADYNDDFCTIRRDMISEGILTRNKMIYRKL